MTIDLNQSPYYDDFDPEKEFKQILAVPGRALQAREFTQAQSILKHHIKRISETLMRDGNIVTGMDFHRDGDTITVEDGLVYIQGFIHNFKEQSVTLSGDGEEIVGVKLVEDIVTSTEDSSLRDQAPGFINYENPGADRLRGTVELTVNDDAASPVYRFTGGELLRTVSPVQRDVLNDTLAKRTYDESGNYRVSGFELYTEEGEDDDIQLTVDAGTAYVLGYEVTKPTPTRISLDKSRETRTINNESKFYRSGNNRYTMNNNPVESINRVNAEVRIQREQAVRGTQIGGTDFLSRQSIAVVDRVWQENPDGSIAHEYIEGEDYQLINAQGISWQPLGEEPSIGQSYFVTFRYNKVMVPNVDYRLVFEGEGENRQYYVEFMTGNNDLPVNDSQFYVDYDFYLARKDLITIDHTGTLTVIRGQSDIQRLVTTPVNNDPNSLHLGTVYISADSASSIPNSFSVTRLDMNDLQGLLRRVQDIEYNQAVTALDKEALDSEQASELRGIFSDGFYNTSKADMFHEDFNVAFSFEDGHVMLPTANTTIGQPGVSDGSRVNQWGRLVTSPMTEEVGLSQSYSTGTVSANPYAMYNTNGTLELVPAVDNWVDEGRIIVENTNTKTNTVHRWWLHAGMEYNDTEKLIFESMTGGSRSTGRIESASGTSVLNQSVQFMREKSIWFRAAGLTRGANNLELHFDGRKVFIEPASGHRAGDVYGSIRGNSAGVARGRFTIPSGVRVGTRQVLLSGPNDHAEGTFTAQGRARNPEKTVFKESPAVQTVNPLAQSFLFDRDRILTSIGLYFATTPSWDMVRDRDKAGDITFQIRNMVNGMPGQTVYAEKTLHMRDVLPHVSYNARNEFKVTFDDPVMCKANTSYCISVVAGHPQFGLFAAELGGFLTETQAHSELPEDRMLQQPYQEGVMFTSSNGTTWTAHQRRDLKMNVYTATFEPEGVIEFEPIVNQESDRIMMLAEYLTPTNTGCDWEIRVLPRDSQSALSAMPYEPISNYDDIDLNEVSKEMQLRASFTADRYMSPVIALDGISLVGFMTSLEGSYVGRNVVFPPGSEYTSVTQTFDGHIPSGCTITPYYSTDGGATWIENDANPVIEPSDDLFNRYTYTTQAPSGSHRNFKARLEITALNAVARPRARRFINIAK